MENQGLGNFCNAKFRVIGYPDEIGVKNVNGRLGAMKGPLKFDEYLRRLKGPEIDLQEVIRSEWVEMSSDLEGNYKAAIDKTSSVVSELDFEQGALIVVGGGHDYAYPWIRAMKEGFPEGSRIGCINLDAHFDLRAYQPVMTSGSPFRRLIEEGGLIPSDLIEFGIQSHCNGSDLWSYAQKMKIETHRMESLRFGKAVPQFARVLKKLRRRVDAVVISLDLDSVSLAFAPGVSAPQPEGFSASEVFQMLEIAGADPKVISLGIFELAPALDVQDHTSRLAAQGAWKFMQHRLSRARR